MERVGDRQDKMEQHCSTGQSLQQAVVPMEEEEDVNLNQHCNLVFQAHLYNELFWRNMMHLNFIQFLVHTPSTKF